MELFNVYGTVGLKDEGFVKGLTEATKSGQSFGKSFNNVAVGISKTVGIISVAVGGMVAAFGKVALDGAMSLEATEAKYNTVFDGFTAQADQMVKDFQKLTPASKASTRSMASGLQDLLVPMGHSREEATKMTTETMGLIGALTNFNSETETAESVQAKFAGALTGETQGLKSLGIQISTATIEQYALAKGYVKSADQIDLQVKSQVILAMATEQSGDALAAYNEESLDTKTKMALMKSQFEDTAASIGADMLPIVNKLMSAFKVFSDAIIPPLSEAFSGLVGIFGNVDGAAEKFASGVQGITNKITEVLPSIIEKGAEIVLSLVSGIVQAAPSLITGIMGVLPTIITTMLEMLPEILDAGMKILLAIVEGIAQALPELIPVAVETLLKLVDAFIANIDLLVDATVAIMLGLADGLITAIPVLIAKAPEIIMQLVTAIVENAPKLLEAAGEIITKLATGLEEMFPALAPITDAFQWLGENIVTVLAVLTPLIAAIAGYNGVIAVQAGLTMAVATGHKLLAAGQAIVTAAQWLLNTALTANPIGVVVAAIGALIAVFVLLYKNSDVVRETLLGAWEAIKSGVGAAISAVTGFFQGLIDFISDNWQAVLLFIIDPISGALKLLYDLNPKFKEWVDGIIDYFKELPVKVSEFFNDIVAGVVKWVEDLIKTVTEEVPRVISDIAKLFEELPEKAIEWGKNLIGGFIDGIGSMITAVTDTVKNVIGGVADFLGFNSPAKKGQGRHIVDWGKNMISGFADGVDDGVPDLTKRLNNVISDFSGDVGVNANVNGNGGIDSIANDNISGLKTTGTTQNITLNVNFDDIDQVSKLTKLFEGFTQNNIAFGGVN